MGWTLNGGTALDGWMDGWMVSFLVSYFSLFFFTPHVMYG